MPKITLTKNSAMVLKRCKPFYDWLLKADKLAKSSDTIAYKGDHSTYIMQDFDTPQIFREFLQHNYLEFFKNELTEWHEADYWPEELTWKLFCDFFEVEYHSQVYNVV